MPRPSPVRPHALDRVALLLFVAVVAAAVVPSQARAQSSDETAISHARARVADVAADLDAARGDFELTAAALEEADARLGEVEQAVNEAAMALMRQEIVVDRVDDDVARLERRARGLQERADVRAASLYKQGAAEAFDVLLQANSIDEFLLRSDLLSAVSQTDRSNLELATNARVSLLARREVLEAERDRFAEMKAEQDLLLAEVSSLRENRLLEAANARSRVEELTSLHEDLEDDAEWLEAIIAQRAAEQTSIVPPAPDDAAGPDAPAPVAAAAPVASSGGYIWPLCARVSSPFGWRWGRMHEGLDIDGNTGDAVRAARSGVVIQSGWSGGYGQMILIDHGNGVVTAYAHLSSFGASSGQAVAQGQYVGAVGSTGNVTGPHLHFEVRVNGGAVDPSGFLSGGC